MTASKRWAEVGEYAERTLSELRHLPNGYKIAVVLAGGTRLRVKHLSGGRYRIMSGQLITAKDLAGCSAVRVELDEPADRNRTAA